MSSGAAYVLGCLLSLMTPGADYVCRPRVVFFDSLLLRTTHQLALVAVDFARVEFCFGALVEREREREIIGLSRVRAGSRLHRVLLHL